MTKEELTARIREKRSFLCVGLDPDPAKMPDHLPKSDRGIYLFCKEIVKAVAPHAIALKPNMAFFEYFGSSGWKALEKLMVFVNTEYPELFTIADAKRGDIGNTARMYASAFYDSMGFDAVTVSPYMGRDSIEPFIGPGKWPVVLALTSNSGAGDFQKLQLEGGKKLSGEVLQSISRWMSEEQGMFVVGATQGEELKEIRRIVPGHYLLVPGVGAQGGSLEEVCKTLGVKGGIIINSSRSIIYASNGKNFATAAAESARKMQSEMQKWI